MMPIAERMSQKGRRVLITGAAGHIGGMMAATLAELGASLVLVDRPGADFARSLAMIDPFAHGGVTTLECDLEVAEARAGLIDQVTADSAGLSVLVNNAAFVGTTELTGWNEPFELQSLETWRRALEVNVTAAFDLSKGLATVLGQASGGAIVNVASIYGVVGPDYRLYEGTSMGNPAAYAVSKGGLLQLTRWLATTLAPRVRVNAITPGGVERGQDPRFIDRYRARTPLARMANDEDFCGAIAYLATDLSAYVTGHNLVVDGGWSAW